MSVKLNHETLGQVDSPSIIILHGLFGSISNWRKIAKHFSKQYQVISLDLRNHGNSPWHERMTYEDLAGDVNTFILENSIIKPHIIGHSMGGKTLMTLIQSSDIKIGASFVIDIAPVKYDRSHDYLLKAMESIDLTDFTTRSEIDAELAKTVQEYGLRQYLMQNLIRDGACYKWRINLKSIISNMAYIIDYNKLNSCNNKIIFVKGEQSDYINSNYFERIYALFPSAKIETISDAGHWLHAEKSGELITIIEKHLNSNNPDLN